MPVKFEVIEHGATAAAKMIEDIGHRAMHAEPAMRKISAVLLLGEQALWKRSGGKKWAPRADGSTPGVLSGDLLRSLTQAEAPGAIREIHADHVVFGTSIWYGKFMQGGTKHEPKRPILVFRPTDRKATKTIIELHLLGELP
jgi:phage gpG-like protein